MVMVVVVVMWNVAEMLDVGVDGGDGFRDGGCSCDGGGVSCGGGDGGVGGDVGRVRLDVGVTVCLEVLL